MAGGVERALDYLAALGSKRPLTPNPRQIESRQPPACRAQPVLQSRTAELQQERVLVSDWLGADAAWRASADPVMPKQHASFLIERSAALRRAGGLLPRRFVRACLDSAAASAAGAPLLVASCLHEQGLIPLVEWLSLLRDQEQLAWGAALAQFHAMASWTDHALPASSGQLAPVDPGHAAAAICDGLLAAVAASAFQPDLATPAGMAGLDEDMHEAIDDNTHGSRGAGGLAGAVPTDQPCARGASETVLRGFLDSSDDSAGFSAGATSAVGMSSVSHAAAGRRTGSADSEAHMGRLGTCSDAQHVWRAARLVRAIAPAAREQGSGKAAARWVLDWLLEGPAGTRASVRMEHRWTDGARGRIPCDAVFGDAVELPSRLAWAAETLDRMSRRRDEATPGVQPHGAPPGEASVVGHLLPAGATAATTAGRRRADCDVVPRSVCTGPVHEAYAGLARGLELTAGGDGLVAMLLRWAFFSSADAQRLLPWLAIARYMCRTASAASAGSDGAGDANGRPGSCLWDSALREAEQALLDALFVPPPITAATGAGAVLPATSGAAPPGSGLDPPAAAARPGRPEGAPAAVPSDAATLGFLLLLHLDLCGCDLYSAAMAPRLQAALAPDGGRSAAGVIPEARVGARSAARLLRALTALVPFLSLPALRLHQKMLRPFACPTGGSLSGVSDLLDLLRTRVSDLSATGGAGGIGATAERPAGAESGAGCGGAGGAVPDPDEADAKALFEEMLDFYRSHKSLTRSAQQVRLQTLIRGWGWRVGHFAHLFSSTRSSTTLSRLCRLNRLRGNGARAKLPAAGARLDKSIEPFLPSCRL